MKKTTLSEASYATNVCEVIVSASRKLDISRTIEVFLQTR